MSDESGALGNWTLAVHGGAGVILPAKMTPEKEAAYRAGLHDALNAGRKILREGGSSQDAVIASVVAMEDSPLFNAGKGAVFTSEGRNEMDAAIMVGDTHEAGAIAGVTNVRNPVLAACAVMEESPHVMLQGTGAEKFAAHAGLEIVDPSYFHTDHRLQQLQKALEMGEGPSLDHSDHKFGTVGAVALDQEGNLAAATSTGGMTNKQWGRVGDSPVIGAGTYASNSSCAVSATGLGEVFIRMTAARTICALMEYCNMSLEAATDQVVNETLKEMGGDGGIVAIDKDGNYALTFNTPGMYRGVVNSDGLESVSIFQD